MCCHIKIERNVMAALSLVIDSLQLSSRYMYVVQTPPTIRSTSVIVCMYLKSTKPCSQRHFQFEDESAEESTRAKL